MSSKSRQGPELNELLERSEISPEAYAEYAATADVAPSSSTDSDPRPRRSAMFDHVTLRVADLAATSMGLAAVLDGLEIEQPTSTPSLSVWGNFALSSAGRTPGVSALAALLISPFCWTARRAGDTERVHVSGWDAKDAVGSGVER